MGSFIHTSQLLTKNSTSRVEVARAVMYKLTICLASLRSFSSFGLSSSKKIKSKLKTREGQEPNHFDPSSNNKRTETAMEGAS